ncbi:pilus assembly protein TadG [Bradyrhizobium sp. LTSP885]|uniref:TadE/TadG family type IV pilus assembly protein n=1 Tax=Bradyrhizobium sp. LTSP885 TaxID=1619232 RepID=UPI0005CA2F7C|nr:TadE/TadG family type IV pilus assembly protein [Bradyrhizobium sp. LTSP885]KJC51671.1 pilus assembly protein TadG [Bradyrhizobium sp. LTSP885]
MRTLMSILRRFRRDRSGNVAIVFALLAVPVLGAVGCAIDYSRANQIRSKLQSAADAASVGSIAKASPGFIAAGAMTSDGPVPAGVADATKIFTGYVANQGGFTLGSVTPAVSKSGGALTSTVQFSATVSTMFLGLMGSKTVTVTGTSTSTANMPQYIDFYLLLDNSPSMGVAATPTDVTKMVSNTPDQCAFACHDLSTANNYYNLAKTLGVTTRIDVLRTATQNLMDTASQYATYPSQFRMAIYDFGGTSQAMGLRSLFSLSSSLSSAKTAAGNIDLMGVWANGGDNDIYTGDKNTLFGTLLPAINNVISNPGSGTSSSPLKYLFFVSDGVTDESNASCPKTMYNKDWGNISPRCQAPIDPALCATLKNRGIKVAVLYTTYLQLPSNTWYMDWLDPFNQGPFGPSPNSQIAQNMQTCASPGLYFEITPTLGISDAMTALFKKAVADARISS